MDGEVGRGKKEGDGEMRYYKSDYYQNPSRLKDAQMLARIPAIRVAAKLKLHSSSYSRKVSGLVPLRYDDAMKIIGALESFGVDVSGLRTPPVKDAWSTVGVSK